MESLSTSEPVRPLIHIGFHKTASTLLQQALFARPDLGFERPYNDRKFIQADFVRRGPFDGVPIERQVEYRRVAQEAAEAGRTLVISHERLSGYPGTGAFDGPIIAQRLKETFPDARILVFVREQLELIASYYLQYITDGGALSFRRLVTRIQPGMYRKPQFDLDVFSFVKTINHYRSLFGSDNVLVVPYEALRRDGWQLARTIAQYAGQDPAGIPANIFDSRANSGMPLVMQMVRRHLNGWINRNQLSLQAPISFGPFNRWYQRLRPAFEFTRALEGPLRRKLEREVRDCVGNRYVQTNRELQILTPYDLQLFGYRMADGPVGSPAGAQRLARLDPTGRLVPLP
ncbi:hypothetical protein [Novosphingobium panipatense]|uniref:Sulfotransferase family protein n=1 Tax=Novosphingobium panipatense TaxID=428991 RepID=A0ABY1QI44_9SPHN|nr:hypothetical protein [Novosphingobium panipatense]SMP71662.1 hypothetical protein SAMN06296065_10654 [Novosphingobium panipatense]